MSARATTIIGIGAACTAVLLGCTRDTPGSSSGSDGSTPGGSTSAPTPWFTEVGELSGIDFVHDSGHRERFLFPEIAAGGGGLFDCDGDGDLDAYLVQSGAIEGGARPTNRLYMNAGDGTFTDVTERAGVGDRGYGMGLACGDVDGDGDTDLYVTNLGANVLYRNDGDGTFTDVTRAAGVGDPSWSTSATFFDGDADGDLDLFVTNNVRWTASTELECFSDDGQPDYCGPENYQAPAADTLYRNEGDGTFTDVSVAAGIRVAFGNGLGVVCGDVDLDGDQDVYVANDGMPNQLWINRGDLTFEDRALIAGVALNGVGAPEAGMGVDAADLEDDGDLDLYVVHLRAQTNTFYRNLGRWFEDATSAVGLAADSRAMTGFGVGLFDFDQDGWLDVYVANGRVKIGAQRYGDDPYAEPDTVHRGTPDAHFEQVPGGAGTCPPTTARAAAFGDVDGDGDVDVLVVNRNHRAYLLRNDRGEGHWIRFRVRERSGTDALGARVALTVGGRTRSAEVRAGMSYLASSDPRVHMGLGASARVTDVTVRWIDGTVERFGDFEADREVELARAE